ncbi:MAG: IclR family transcriptional regulator, partial [Methyloligellaceae bacterium]
MGQERIQVIDRAVELMGLVAQKGTTSIADLSRETGYAVSTVARIMGALTSHGIVERTAGRKFRLGLRLIALASQVVPTRSIVEIAREPMQELARSTGEDAGLAVLQDRQAVIIDWVYGPHPLKIIEPFSQAITLNCAFRKVLLAFQGDKWVRNYLATTTFPQYTPHTIVGPDDIWQELQRIRKMRIAVSRGENILDAGSVAVPVFAATGELVATA